MIRFSIIGLFVGLQYYGGILDSGAQTARLGQAWPVSRLLGSCRSPAAFLNESSAYANHLLIYDSTSFPTLNVIPGFLKRPFVVTFLLFRTEFLGYLHSGSAYLLH
jgi:hypothetical protein